jgi:hypothetical protein
MGRETRQARRARERREQQRRAHRSTSLSNRYSLLAGGAIVAVLLVLLASLAFAKGGSSVATTVNGTPVTPTLGPITPAPAYKGIACNAGEMLGQFHEHAHLNLIDDGKLMPVSDQIGFSPHDCLYWMHTHTPSQGVIHMEAPHSIYPKLATFFHLWGRPLTSKRISNFVVKPGQKIRAFINRKPYYGNPGNIILRRHEDVTIEVGPPFVKPPPLFPFVAKQL